MSTQPKITAFLQVKSTERPKQREPEPENKKLVTKNRKKNELSNHIELGDDDFISDDSIIVESDCETVDLDSDSNSKPTNVNKKTAKKQSVVERSFLDSSPEPEERDKQTPKKVRRCPVLESSDEEDEDIKAPTKNEACVKLPLSSKSPNKNTPSSPEVNNPKVVDVEESPKVSKRTKKNSDSKPADKKIKDGLIGLMIRTPGRSSLPNDEDDNNVQNSFTIDDDTED